MRAAVFHKVGDIRYGLRHDPEGLKDEQALFLTDIFPTGRSAIEWGETVAIFGLGPVGLMAQKAAWLQGVSRVIAIDPAKYRLERARWFNKVETLNPNEVDVVEAIRSMTEERGVDLFVDAVGMEADRSFPEKAKAVINREKGTPKVLKSRFQDPSGRHRICSLFNNLWAYGLCQDHF